MTARKKIPLLSKSRFMSGLQCHKRLYLELFQPELAATITADQQAIFDQGTAVGIEAREFVPGGVPVEADHLHHREAVEQTASLLADRKVPAIYEAGFLHDDVRVRADILARVRGGKYDLYEVKSSTQFKEEHLWDVAIQTHVLRGAGVPLRRANLLLINTDYVYPGGPYDHQQLFYPVDLTADVEAVLPEIPHLLRDIRADLAGDAPPAIPVGDHCTSPYECPFIEQCWPPPVPYAVDQLYRAGAKLKAQLAEDGIASIREIPADYPGLSPLNQRIRDAIISGEAYRDGATRDVMAALARPVRFMDFETFSPALPLFAGTRPYQAIPFQWSVHALQADGTVRHDAYLHEDHDDPRHGFLASLLQVLGKRGSICVYSSYEQTQLKALREAFPEHAEAIDAVIARLVDLLPVVRNHIYHPDFGGSFSIKSVYPALVPASGYDGLTITDGSSASVAYATLLAGALPPADAQQVRQDLLDYCNQDTEALLALYHHLAGDSP